jgi:hypothetical protein
MAVLIRIERAAVIHTRLQGILITGAGMGVFIVAMLLIPRTKIWITANRAIR